MMDKRTTGIVAYLTVVGWILAYVAGDRSGAKFHLNQALVLCIAEIAVSLVISWGGFLRVIGSLFALLLFVLWLIGFLGALQNREDPAPIISEIHLLK